MAATRASVADVLVRGLEQVFSTSYDEIPSMYDNVYNVINSNRDYEEFLQFAGFGYAPTETEMEVVQLQEALLGFRIKLTPVRYGLGYEVSQELVEDEKYGWIAALSTELARALRSTREKTGADLFNNGFSAAAAFQYADLLALFSTAHTLKRGGTFSNRLATDSDLTYSSLATMASLIRRQVNDAGIPVNTGSMNGGALTLIVHPDNEFNAAEILKSVGRPDTANRSDNVLNKVRTWNFVVWDYLTDLDAFFVVAEKSKHKLLFIDRMKERQFVKVDDETFSVKHISRSRFKVGAADARGIAGTPGA